MTCFPISCYGKGENFYFHTTHKIKYSDKCVTSKYPSLHELTTSTKKKKKKIQGYLWMPKFSEHIHVNQCK